MPSDWFILYAMCPPKQTKRLFLCDLPEGLNNAFQAILSLNFVRIYDRKHMKHISEQNVGFLTSVTEP